MRRAGQAPEPCAPPDNQRCGPQMGHPARPDQANRGLARNPTRLLSGTAIVGLCGSQADNAGSTHGAGDIYRGGVDARPHDGEDGPVVAPDRRSQEMVDLVGAMFGPALRRAQAVAPQLIGLSGKDARQLAARSRCIIRAVRIDGRSLMVPADYAAHRIDVATQDGIIVEVLSPRESAEEPHD
jgi:hypothetical protein